MTSKPRSRRVMYISPSSAGDLSCRAELESIGYQVDILHLDARRSWAIILKSLFIRKALGTYDAVITNEYFSAFGINLRLIVTRCRARHVTIGLNQSRRLIKTSMQSINGLVDRVFGRTDRIVVHSRREINLFSHIHGIDRGKIVFSPWGFDLPVANPSIFSYWPRRYVCSIGRNNRDVALFVRVMRSIDADGVIITTRADVEYRNIPDNIKIFYDMPMGEAMDCLKHATINAIFLKDDERGAGHITAVAAMLSGIPQIASDVDAIKDYLIDGFNATLVPLGDERATQRAIASLLENPVVASTLGQNGKHYAIDWLSNAKTAERNARAIDSTVREQPLDAIDPAWLLAHDLAKRGSIK